MNLYIYIHKYTHACTHTHAYMHTHIYVYIYIHIHIHTYMDTYTSTYAHTCTYTYIYIHMPMHITIYLSIYIYRISTSCREREANVYADVHNICLTNTPAHASTCKCMPTLCKKMHIDSCMRAYSTVQQLLVGAGLIQFVYRSHLRLATEATRNRNAFSPFFARVFYSKKKDCCAIDISALSDNLLSEAVR